MRANASGGGRKKNKKNTVGRASSSKRTICLNANSQLHRPYFIELEEIQFPISVLCNREDKASERARGKEDSSCISIYVQISRIGCFFSFFFFSAKCHDGDYRYDGETWSPCNPMQN